LRHGDIELQARFESDGSVELARSQAGLEAIASILRRSQGARIRLRQPADSPGPHAEWISFLEVRVEDEAKMTMAIERGELLLAGEPSSLEILAENLSYFAENPGGLGGHLHIEYHPDHFYLRPGTVPMVVVKLLSKGRGIGPDRNKAGDHSISELL
jgi:hypothetical protein